MAFADSGLYARVRPLLPELLKFGVIGGIGSVIDLGGAAVLHGKYHVGPLESKAISTAVATVFTYLGSRFWTFKDRENQSLRREAVLFVLLNLAGLLIAEAVIAFVVYALGRHSGLEYNAASVLGTGLATIFRYFAYKQWVFTAPADAMLAAVTEPELVAQPGYAPWEINPAFLHGAPAAAPVPVAAHAAAPVHATAPAPALAPAPTYSDPWQPAAEQNPWEPAVERQPWMEKQVTLPNERLTESLLATRSSTGPDLGPADPAGAQPFQGRHRRP